MKAIEAPSEAPVRPTGPRAGRTAALAGAVVFAACLGVVVATPGDAYWIVDCGNKALVAQRLLDTGFGDARFDYPAVRLDPEGRWFPIPVPFALARADGFVSAYPPAYPALAAPLLGLLGPRGLRLPAALGVAASAALFVVWAAPALGRRWALAGALVLGLASPLFFYGVTVWEHSLTVALTLAGWVLISREGTARWAAAGAVAGAACWLREDLALVVLAVAAGAALRRHAAGLWIAYAAGAAAPVIGLVLFNDAFYGSPLGGHVAANLGAGVERTVFAGGAQVSRLAPVPGLLGGFGRGGAERWGFGSLGVALPVAGWIAGRRGARPRWLVPALAGAGCAVWLVAFLRIAGSDGPLRSLVLHNGLLLQWPMAAVAGFGLRRVWRESIYSPLRTAVLSGVLFVALVVTAGAIAPSDFGVQVGAGVHWGPRVLLPALPVLVLLAVAAVRGAGRGHLRIERVAWGALVGAGILSTALATWMLAQQKLEAVRFTRHLERLEPGVILTVHPLLAQHLAPLWSHKTTLLVADAPSLERAVRALRRDGVREFLWVVPPVTPVSTGLWGFGCRKAVEHRGRHLHYFDLDVQRCALEGPARRAPR